MHTNAAITGLKHQRGMEREFPCAVKQASLLLCKGFLGVIAQAVFKPFITYIHTAVIFYCVVTHRAGLAPLRTRRSLIGV